MTISRKGIKFLWGYETMKNYLMLLLALVSGIQLYSGAGRTGTDLVTTMDNQYSFTDAEEPDSSESELEESEESSADDTFGLEIDE